MEIETNRKYSTSEKEEIFIKRTQSKYPKVWSHYTGHILHEKMTEKELAAYNFEQRKAIVKFAYKSTKFYRDLYDSAGFNPDDLNTEEDWNRIPCITKEMIREKLDEIVVGGINSEQAKTFGKAVFTGGSTGTPVKIIRDMRNEQAGSTIWRSRGWWLGRHLGEFKGTTPVLGQNEGIIWRMSGPNEKSTSELEKEKAAFFPTQKFYLDAQNMSPEVMTRFIQKVQKDGIVFLRGYAGALIELANHCLANDLTCKPQAIGVVANPIDGIGRRIINEAFHCPVYDVYGSTECQNMAHECPHSENHLHVLSDLRHIDILDEERNPVLGEEEGSVYITSFTNYIMPLIRYSLGDRTHWVKKRCKCGLPFPLIHRILGRESSVILDKNGYQIYAPASHVYIESDCISGYQFVVHDKGIVTIRLIPNYSNPNYHKGINNIKRYYTEHYAGRVDFDFELVDSISHDDGKMRYILYEKKNEG